MLPLYNEPWIQDQKDIWVAKDYEDLKDGVYLVKKG